MAYGIAGVGGDIAALKSAGFVDMHYVVPGGSPPTSASSFVGECNGIGVSPIFNNGNDSISGCAGYDPTSYYQTVANLGWHAAGGESEQYAEDVAIQNSLIFMNYGGEGLNPLSNIFANVYPANAQGHGIASYLESYKSDYQLYGSEVINSAVIAANHGCKEVGIMIGAWETNHGFTSPQPYIDMADGIEAQGVTCAGFVLWAGYDYSMNVHYNMGNNPAIMQALMAQWPPNMTTLKARWEGASATSGGTGGTTPTVSSNPIIGAAAEFDIMPYLTKAHNGQPTTGRHYVMVQPQAITSNVNINVRVRNWQPWQE